MAEALGRLCHHGTMNDAQRREAVARWLSGQGRPVMVATTGLGTGLYFRGIVLIIHCGIPYGLVDYIQQTGRGARQEVQFVQCVAVYDGLKRRLAWSRWCIYVGAFGKKPYQRARNLFAPSRQSPFVPQGISRKTHLLIV